MKTLCTYLTESQESLWHFTNSGNLARICKNDAFTCSFDDGHNPEGYEYYISTSRQRNSLTGYPTQMLNKDIVRVELDERLLHSRFRISAVDFNRAKWYAIKSKWENPDDFNKYHKDIMLQSNVECEDRVLLKQPDLKHFHKYIKRIQINNGTVDPGNAEDIIKYCDKWDIPCDVITDQKRFDLGLNEERNIHII